MKSILPNNLNNVFSFAKKTQEVPTKNSLTITLVEEDGLNGTSIRPQNIHGADEVLITVDEIIEICKKAGVDFGTGNPSERIRYFIKIGLLPHMIRKAPNGARNTKDLGPISTVGHLPFSVIETIKRVHFLKDRGKSYLEISALLKAAKNPEKLTPNKSAKQKPIAVKSPRQYLSAYLAKKNAQKVIEEKLKKHTEILKTAIENDNNLLVSSLQESLRPLKDSLSPQVTDSDKNI